MKSTIIINHPQKMPPLPPSVRAILPERALYALQQTPCRHIEEIRLRIDHACSVMENGTNIPLPSLCWTRADMETLLLAACDGSPYAYRTCMDRGYLPLRGGVRIGICGTVGNTSDADGSHLQHVDSVNIRIPARFPGVGQGILPTVRAAFPRGTLIYAPPAVGKTTLLRALTSALSCGQNAMRVVLVDSRRELDDGAFSRDAALDILSGYPKREGIEIAARTLGAQVIVCDELGSGEARAVLSATLCGVPLIASAHAANLRQLLARPELRMLHGAGTFGCYVGLLRAAAGADYAYTVTPWEEVRGV